MIDRDRFIEVLVRFATTLGDQDYPLADVLGALGEEVSNIVGARGAGLMLEDDQGDLHFVSASDQTLTRLEELQIELDEGPCLLAYREGVEVDAADLRVDDRFPNFREQAVAEGMASVYSVPVRARGLTLGALNIYDSQPRNLDDEERHSIAVLADVAASYLVHSREVERSKILNTQLSEALTSRVVIEQAKGFVMARLEIGPDEARERLRSYARSRQEKMGVVAQDVLAGTLAPEDLPEA